MTIRSANKKDISACAAMRNILWPDSIEVHEKEINAFFEGSSNDIKQIYIIENDAAQPAGFIELNIRNFAEGSIQPMVPYVEGWFVNEKNRGKGYGIALMNRAEKWAKEMGYAELASDTEVVNTYSEKLHKKFGFKETERVIYFLKKLD